MSIEVKNLNYIYSPHTSFEHHALHDVNITIGDHIFLALVGETGSGKSTLVQTLNGLSTPTSGSIKMNKYYIEVKDGKRVLKDLSLTEEQVNKLKRKQKNKQFDIKALRKYAGLVFQFPEYQLFEETVLKDVMFGPLNFGASEDEAKEMAIKALKEVGINEEYFSRSPFELSGGEKRRVAIAGILSLNPEVLVLDEPTAGLDPQGEKEMMKLFKSIYDLGKSIILVTHNMEIVLKYAEEVCVMSKGIMMKETTPLKLFQDTEFLRSVAIEPPLVFKTALALIEHGLAIDIAKIKDIKSLADEISRVKAHE